MWFDSHATNWDLNEKHVLLFISIDNNWPFPIVQSINQFQLMTWNLNLFPKNSMDLLLFIYLFLFAMTTNLKIQFKKKLFGLLSDWAYVKDGMPPLSIVQAIPLALKWIQQINSKCGLQNTQKQTKSIFGWRCRGNPVDWCAQYISWRWRWWWWQWWIIRICW